MPEAAWLISVSGPDRPGITAGLVGVLAQAQVRLQDVEQVVVRGHLTLALLVEAPFSEATQQALSMAAAVSGVSVSFTRLAPATEAGVARVRYAVTVLGAELSAADVHALSLTLARFGANIERIHRLSETGLSSLEMHVALLPEQAPKLKHALLELSVRGAFDVALQRESLFRRSKRLLVMDMDSTLIRIEVINELARVHGVEEAVSAITERAMRGEMDYDTSLRLRLALLKGLDVSALETIAQNLPLTEGAETLVRVLKRLGFKTAVISGGFSHAAEALRTRLGIDYAYSNVLEIQNGKLTGNVVGPIVNAERKAQLLETLASAENILLDQVVAVGDGANDLLMLERAGLGIAFRAKPKLREAADTSLSRSGLDGVLYLLGLNAADLAEALRPDPPLRT
ncbi:MAG: phosphoserine phosphatase SerB [Myxococcaceae bacterium]